MSGDEAVPLVATLISFAMFVPAVTLSGHVDRRIKQRGALWGAGGGFIQVLSSWQAGSDWLYSNSAVTLICLAMWWYWGGGDGLKRRWKSFVAGFGPRMMPKGSS